MWESAWGECGGCEKCVGVRRDVERGVGKSIGAGGKMRKVCWGVGEVTGDLGKARRTSTHFLPHFSISLFTLSIPLPTSFLTSPHTPTHFFTLSHSPHTLSHTSPHTSSHPHTSPHISSYPPHNPAHFPRPPSTLSYTSTVTLRPVVTEI